MEDSRDADHRRMDIAPLLWIGTAWATLVAAILAWQAFEYRGFFAWAAEWQFRYFDRMYPVATIVLVTALLSLPFLILIALRMRRRRRLYGRLTLADRIRREEAIAWLIGAPAIVSAVLAVLLLAMALYVGSLADKPVTRLSLTSREEPVEGMASARGWVLLNRIGFYRERAVVVGRDLLVAPLVAREDAGRIRYFVEVDDMSAREPEMRDVEGLLRVRALPGGLEQLYENAGYVIERPTHIVYRSRTSARWPLLSAAADLAFFAVLLAIGFALHRRHLRKLRKVATEAVPTPAAT